MATDPVYTLRTDGMIDAVSATLMAMIKELRARDPDAVKALQTRAETELDEISSNPHSLSYLRNALFLDD